MKILYVLPYLPSPIRVRPFQIIRALSALGHRVTVVALEDEFATAGMVADLRAICDAVHLVPHPRLQGAIQATLALASPLPLWAAYCFSGVMERKLVEVVAADGFDVAHIEHLRAAHFVDAIAPLPVIIDAVDCLTALRAQMRDVGDSFLSRLLSWEEWSKLRSYEPRVYGVFPHITVTSAHDRAALMRLASGLPPITVISNGVDCDYFRPDAAIPPQADTLVFSGKMSYEANDAAARYLLTRILPRLRELRPATRVVVAGSRPSESLRALAARVGGVTVTGFVEDLRPFLSQASVAVCPMQIGAGIQNKALEAMAMGRPVICSPVAARALSGAVRAGAGVRVAETAVDFACACAEQLAAPTAETLRAGAAARAYVEREHRWPDAARAFVALYEAVIATPPRAASASSRIPTAGLTGS